MKNPKNEKRYFAFIPVVNGFDLLAKAVDSVADYFHEIVIIDNSAGALDEHRQRYSAHQILTVGDRSFAGAQNWARNYAIDNEYDFYVFMHNDGEAVGDMPRQFIQLVNEHYTHTPNWGVIFTRYDVICAFNTEAVREVGPWGDDRWPEQSGLGSYVFDIDYYRRIRLAGYETVQTRLGPRVIHHPSSTINNDPELKKTIQQNHRLARRHYIAKWGGPKRYETYSVPFGTPEEIETKLSTYLPRINPECVIETVGSKCRVFSENGKNKTVFNESTRIILAMVAEQISGAEILENVRRICQKSGLDIDTSILPRDVLDCLEALKDSGVIRIDEIPAN